ncbi:MAG TPA: zinc-binding dehydrogenase [Abditibacteriaceae bacterium]|nr:zinc-binding dehydrogenase [Abditibacteriaceae bacterium]
MQAQAVVATEPRQIAYQTVQVPEPTAGDVVLRVLHSWISNGTEGSFVRGERIQGDTPWTASDPSPFPHVPGYQKIGVVEWVGSDVHDFQIGEIVFATISHIDGMFYEYGGHISPAVTPRSQIWKLPATIEPLSISGLVLTQVGYNVGVRPPVQKGDAAVVIGDGLVGHWSAQTLRHRGARVMLLGKHDERLERWEMANGDRLVNITREDPLTVIMEWAPEGVQVLVDTVGSVTSIEALYSVMRHDSHLVSAGFYGTQGAIDIQKMRAREMTLHTPAGWTKERMDATLSLLEQGVLKTLHLITHRFPVAQAAAAFELILSRREPCLGVILDWE